MEWDLFIYLLFCYLKKLQKLRSLIYKHGILHFLNYLLYWEFSGSD